MTESEAIGVIKRLVGISPSEQIVKAIDFAISSLKEIQQYRAIGTVDECRDVMEIYRKKKPIILSEQSTESGGQNLENDSL